MIAMIAVSRNTVPTAIVGADIESHRRAWVRNAVRSFAIAALSGRNETRGRSNGQCSQLLPSLTELRDWEPSKEACKRLSGLRSGALG